MTGNLMFTGGARYVGTSDANNLVLRTNNADRVILAAAGNVGIGTVPATRLHVHSTDLGTDLRVSTPSQTINVGVGLPGAYIQGSSGLTLQPSGGDVNASNNKIINVAMPAANFDAANKKYVDDAVTNAIDVSCSSDCTTGPPGTQCSDGAIYLGYYATPGGAYKRLYVSPFPDSTSIQWHNLPSGQGCNVPTEEVPEDGGMANTNMMLSSSCATHPVAELCRAKGAKWFVPSPPLAKFVFAQMAETGVARYGSGGMWTSHQYSAGSAYHVSLVNGVSSQNPKYLTLSVYCTRFE